MLKRDDIELEHADAGNGNGATRTLSRGERLALLADEDERAPRVKVAGRHADDRARARDEGLRRTRGRACATSRCGSTRASGCSWSASPARASRRSSACCSRSSTRPRARSSSAAARSATLKRSRVAQLRRNIGCVFQDFKLLPNRNAYQNVAYALEVQGQPRHEIDEKVPEILQLVGLGDKFDRFPHELSGGEQQRVSIARAFVNHPPLLICDEPTGNLDPDTSVGIMQLLYRINRTGTTVVMATHDREMVDRMRRRVVALERGRLVRDERRGGYVET